MSIDVVLIRHGEVEASYRKICYGQMDVPLSDRGKNDSLARAAEIASAVQPAAIYHSGLVRTQFLADAIADQLAYDVTPTRDDRLRERDYGDWQGKTWDEAYHSDPERFHHLVERPDSYRPPNGETTSQMQARIVEWFGSVLRRSVDADARPVVAISHSGPMASLLGSLQGLPATRWESVMPTYLQGYQICNGEIAAV